MHINTRMESPAACTKNYRIGNSTLRTNYPVMIDHFRWSYPNWVFYCNDPDPWNLVALVVKHALEVSIQFTSSINQGDKWNQC